MKPLEKMWKFVEMRGLRDAEFAELLATSPSAVSEMRRGKRGLSMPMARRAAKAMGVSLVWLMDDAAGWPPPLGNREGQPTGGAQDLTAAERRVLDAARMVSGEDPELREALNRLVLRGYRKEE